MTRKRVSIKTKEKETKVYKTFVDEERAAEDRKRRREAALEHLDELLQTSKNNRTTFNE